MGTIGAVAAAVLLFAGVLGTIAGFIWFMERLDKPRRSRNVPPDPPSISASSKQLAIYHRKVAKWYRTDGRIAEAEAHENLAIGYEQID